MPEAITHDERRDRLRLIRTENVGPVTWRELMARHGSAGAVIDALPDIAARAGRRAIRVPAPAEAERELDRLAKLGAQVVTLGEAAYPGALAAIDDAPPILSVLGDAALLSRPAVAVVGARNASANGRRLAASLAGDLAGRDSGADPLVVVSGLARGIDTAAHTGALEAPGATIAVMAGGVDHVYPPENERLHARIAAEGAVVSEMPPGLQPQARHFPRRNRIVAGLSLGIVVVEAARRSGSLITARMAGEQGREVFAVPGSPLDPRAWGANTLIRDGATLIRDANDVREALQPLFRSANPGSMQPPEDLLEASCAHETATDSARASVLDALSPEPVAVDEIVRQCQLTAPVVRTILLELELAGRVERHPGNRVAAFQGVREPAGNAL